MTDTNYYRSEIEHVIASGPAGGPEYRHKVKVFGNHDSKHLDVSVDALLNLADSMDTDRPASLLPLKNGARVIRADTWVNLDGSREGVVLCEVGNIAGEPYVTWRVSAFQGDVRWVASNGDYCSTIEAATASFNDRRGVTPIEAH